MNCIIFAISVLILCLPIQVKLSFQEKEKYIHLSRWFNQVILFCTLATGPVAQHLSKAIGPVAFIFYWSTGALVSVRKILTYCFSLGTS